MLLCQTQANVRAAQWVLKAEKLTVGRSFENFPLQNTFFTNFFFTYVLVKEFCKIALNKEQCYFIVGLKRELQATLNKQIGLMRPVGCQFDMPVDPSMSKSTY